MFVYERERERERETKRLEGRGGGGGNMAGLTHTEHFSTHIKIYS
jgi:hypothetical protein